jgi:hypothetical protein
MARVGVSLCGLCGARTESFPGRLTLIGYPQKQGGKGYDCYSARTIRSWALCKDCMRKLSGVQTAGDRVIKDLELMIDKVRLEHETPQLLEDMKGRER